MFGNSEASCSNDHISQNTRRILMVVTLLESTYQVLSSGESYSQIRRVL